VIEACGVRHEIIVSLDPGGNVVVSHEHPPSERVAGTKIVVPTTSATIDWAMCFAIFNPHASLADHGQSEDGDERGFYKPTVNVNGDWRKPLPTDRMSPWWYDRAAMEKLVFARVGASRNGNGGADLAHGTFIRQFDGLASTGKAKAVAAQLPGIERLSDFADQPQRVASLACRRRCSSRRASRRPARSAASPRSTTASGSTCSACSASSFGARRCWMSAAFRG